jgi:DNA-binding YbaB/EbfC family protein
MKSLDDILKMAANVQAELAKAQDSLVKVTASARGRIVRLSIDESLLSPDQKEMTEDLVVAALNDARARADALAQAEMQKMTAGLPLPPGFKL